MAPPRLYFVAGEPSGDAHAAGVLTELLAQAPGLTAAGLGGPLLAQAGMELRADLATEAVMGIFPVIKAFPRLRRLFYGVLDELERTRPDALVLVDYPGFNLRLAAQAHRLGIPIIYYISPQVWAWAKGRIRKIAKTVDLMLPILPFEAEIFRIAGMRATYVGHPLLDALKKRPSDQSLRAELRALGGSPLIGIFPGSRRHVVESLLPTFLETVRVLRDHHGWKQMHGILALAQESHREILDATPHQGLPITTVVGQSTDVMAVMDLGLTTSGTTTLEITAHNKPFVLGYRVSPIFYGLGKLLISVPHIGLVNLVAGRGVVPEHVGVRSFAAAAASDLVRLHTDSAARQTQLDGLAEVNRKLDTPGAYARAAREILDFLALD